MIKKGNKVKIDYTGTFDDGTVFDASEKHGKPLEFEVGAGQIIPGLDEAIVGMEKDEEKEIKIIPEKAYGNRNPELVKKIPRDKLPKDKEIKPGMMLMMGTAEGTQFPATIVEATDTEVTIDLNHPLVDKTLNFKFKIVDIN